MDSAQNQLLERLHSATNILVTVSRDPSVDQLAACIGLTLLLNKLNKHATAVYSGQTPSTIEFLEPEQTIEKNTDSLRDFIIALDKSKADKLRYKVEDDRVRIFITPYKTSISQADLEFSQGDFNVDMVLALGVTKQEDLDEAITSHGRILHDATLTSINTSAEGGLGSINWNDPQASSLCELVADLVKGLGHDLYDAQIATALLTGVVAETNRFSNDKTTPTTMSVSAELMSAGANQQLIASKLDEPGVTPAGSDDQSSPDAANDTGEAASTDDSANNDGTLEIAHADEEAPLEEVTEETTEPETSEPDDVEPAEEPASPPEPEATTEVEDTPAAEPEAEEVVPAAEAEPETPPETELPTTSRLITEPPLLGGRLTANSQPEAYDPSTDPLSLPSIEQHLLNRDVPANTLAELSQVAAAETAEASSPTLPAAPTPTPAQATTPEPAAPTPPEPVTPTEPAAPQPLMVGFTPPPPAWVPPSADALNFGAPSEPTSTAPVGLADPQTLSDLEAIVKNDSPSTPPPAIDDARDEVMKALQGSESTLEPIQALNAQPLVDNLNAPAPAPEAPATPDFSESLPQTAQPLPPAPTTPAPGLTLPTVDATPADQPADDGTPKPPPVPPPMQFSNQPPIPFHFGNTTEPPKQ